MRLPLFLSRRAVAFMRLRDKSGRMLSAPTGSIAFSYNKQAPAFVTNAGAVFDVLFGLAIAVGVILNAGEKFVGKGLLIFYGNTDLLAV